MVGDGFLPAGEAGGADLPVVAVLPIRNPGGQPDVGSVVQGLEEYLIASLARHSDIRVISRTSSTTYRNSDKTLPQIARELRTGALVEGDVAQRGEQMEVSLRLIDATSDRRLWSGVLSLDQDGTNALADTARDLAGELVAALTGTEAVPRPPSHAGALRLLPDEALDHYQRGRYLLLQSGSEHWQPAVAAFDQALAAAPDYAPAHVGLVRAQIRSLGGDSVRVRQALPELRRMLDRALQLAPALADAHLELAKLAFLYEWDFPLAERHFKAALAGNPSHAQTHFHYSQFLLAMGRFNEAIREVRSYRTLDPFSYSVPSVAWIYNMMGIIPGRWPNWTS